MTRVAQSHVAARVANQFSMNPEEAGVIIDRLLAEILQLTAAGQAVTFKNFGSFRTVTRKARTGRNPGTGEPVAIPAQQVLLFRAAKSTARPADDGAQQ